MTTLNQKLGAHIERWALKRLPSSDQITLSQNNIYVWPTAVAAFLAAMLIIFLIASINYQANLGFLLCFMLAACAFMSLLVGHSVLRGLRLQLQAPAPIFAGEAAKLVCQLSHADKRPHIGVVLLAQNTPLDDNATHSLTVEPNALETIAISTQPLMRGIHACPTITITTRFPLGIFRIWSLWKPQSNLLVYPKPEQSPPAFPIGYEPDNATGNAARSQSSEFDGFRSYQRGDPLKTIAWKKTATAMATGTGEWVRRDPVALNETRMWLDYQATQLGEKEAALSRLCAWVLKANEQGLHYGLRLPNQTIAPDTGVQHLQKCLRAMAQA